MDFRFYFSLFMRRFHWFALMAIICGATGIAVARLLPTVYIAEAKLVVESEQIPDELAASTVQTQATEQLQIIQQRILTRDTLVEMANRLKIYAPAAGERAIPMDADDLVKDMRSRISIITTGGAAGRGPAQATLVAVSFEAPTAALAAAVTNDVVTLILREDIEMRTGAARQTLQFFEQEVSRLDKELAERGATILTFKEANKDALPDSLEFRRSQQAAGQERLLQQQRDEAELNDRRTRLKRLHDATGTTADATPLQQLTPEQQKMRALQDEMSAGLAVLSPTNPKIKLLASQIAALEKVVAAQTAAGGLNAQGQQMSAYDIQMAEMDGQLAYMADQAAQIASAMQVLQITIEATPGNAIALDTLERDYAGVRAQYDQAVSNKARAETGDTIEVMARGQRISVIEQAVAPRDPTRPNRPMIAAGGVIGGLGFGAALVALIELLNVGIRRPADVTAKLGITVFATLPYLITDHEIRRRRMRAIATFLGILAVIAAILWAINTYYAPLDLLLNQAIQQFSLLGTPRTVVA